MRRVGPGRLLEPRHSRARSGFGSNTALLAPLVALLSPPPPSLPRRRVGHKVVVCRRRHPEAPGRYVAWVSGPRLSGTEAAAGPGRAGRSPGRGGLAGEPTGTASAAAWLHSAAEGAPGADPARSRCPLSGVSGSSGQTAEGRRPLRSGRGAAHASRGAAEGRRKEKGSGVGRAGSDSRGCRSANLRTLTRGAAPPRSDICPPGRGSPRGSSARAQRSGDCRCTCCGSRQPLRAPPPPARASPSVPTTLRPPSPPGPRLPAAAGERRALPEGAAPSPPGA